MPDRDDALIRLLPSGREFRRRDLAILRELFDSRQLRVDHLARMFFASKHSAYKRINALKSEQLIGERERLPNQSGLLFLAERGFEMLVEEGAIDDYPKLSWRQLEKRLRVSELTVRHELAVASVKAALTEGIVRSDRFRIGHYTSWPQTYAFETVRPGPTGGEEDYKLEPDGFLRVHEHADQDAPFEHDFYIEVDRTSEMTDLLAHKAYGYQKYYQRGGHAERCGATRDRYQDYPFLVLMVFRSAERRNNIAARLLQNRPPVLTQAWLTTQAEIEADPLGAIWIRPRDYRDVTADTPFDGARQVFKGYITNPAREAFIEANLPRRQLFEEVTGP